MPDDTNTTGPINNGQPAVTPDPSSSSDGKSDDTNKGTEAPSQLPQHLQGKGIEDVVKMYGELERKFGEQSGEVGKLRKVAEQFEFINKVVTQDPELLKRMDEAIGKVTGKTTTPAKVDDKKPGSGEGDSSSRKYLENKIVDEFASNFGLSNLKPEEKQAELTKVGQALVSMLDPTGQRDVTQVLQSIPLEKLPEFLENAYWVANKAKIAQGGTQQNFASIGRMSTSSSKSGSDISLTDSERNIAKKLGVSEEDYLKNKKAKLENS